MRKMTESKFIFQLFANLPRNLNAANRYQSVEATRYRKFRFLSFS